MGGEEVRMSTHTRDIAERTQVEDVMTREVISVKPTIGVEAVEAMLVERGLSRVPVVDDDQHPIGMIGKSDLIREHVMRGDTGGVQVSQEVAPGRPAAAGMHVHEVDAIVRDVMTPFVASVSEHASLAEAARKLLADQLHAFPVVDDRGRLVGMLSATDVVAWVAGARPARH
jgi:CBS domain-containing protein